MTRVFYDTEFLEDGRTVDLISIGMITDDGREYYAVNSDCDWDRVRQHQWLVENVVPHLPLTVDSQPALDRYFANRTNGNFAGLRGVELDLGRSFVKPHRVIANEVRDFLRAAAAGGEVDLWAWYGAYDHVALAQLFGRMIDLPDGVPMWTNDLRQERRRLGDPALPAQRSVEHNALADARHNRVMARFMDALA